MFARSEVRWPARAAWIALALVAFTAVACADSDVVAIGAGGLRDAGVPGFVGSPDAGPDTGETPPSTPAALCIATDCVAPFATCPNAAGTLSRYRCTTDLSSDPMNCGACGNDCGAADSALHVLIPCVDGACQAVCFNRYLDCNGIVDDGCESDPLEDPHNCGACGIDCGPGGKCIGGKCGCDPGSVECNGQCRDLTSDDANCGACGHDCAAETADAGPIPPHMTYGCSNSSCSQLECAREGGSFWADCNQDLADGCEVDLTLTDENGHYDANNCGQCGRKCAPGVPCVNSPVAGITCLECPIGQTRCGDLCLDTDVDPANCGACGNSCRSPVRIWENEQGGQVVCDRGRCGYACKPGFADCNDNIEDGCEVELARDPHHCGQCGAACDNGVGQPCINGQCAMTDCDAGGPVK